MQVRILALVAASVAAGCVLPGATEAPAGPPGDSAPRIVTLEGPDLLVAGGIPSGLSVRLRNDGAGPAILDEALVVLAGDRSPVLLSAPFGAPPPAPRRLEPGEEAEFRFEAEWVARPPPGRSDVVATASFRGLEPLSWSLPVLHDLRIVAVDAAEWNGAGMVALTLRVANAGTVGSAVAQVHVAMGGDQGWYEGPEARVEPGATTVLRVASDPWPGLVPSGSGPPRLDLTLAPPNSSHRFPAARFELPAPSARIASVEPRFENCATWGDACDLRGLAVHVEGASPTPAWLGRWNVTVDGRPLPAFHDGPGAVRGGESARVDLGVWAFVRGERAAVAVRMLAPDGSTLAAWEGSFDVPDG